MAHTKVCACYPLPCQTEAHVTTISPNKALKTEWGEWGWGRWVCGDGIDVCFKAHKWFVCRVRPYLSNMCRTDRTSAKNKYCRGIDNYQYVFPHIPVIDVALYFQ